MNNHDIWKRIIAAILIIAMAATSIFTLLYYLFTN